MLEARPISIFSRDFSIEAGGQRVALLDVSHWREAGEVLIEGQPHRLYREGLMSGAFVLENQGQALARAIKPSALSSQFNLEIDARPYFLKRDSAFRRAFSVFEGESLVGTIRPAGIFTRRASLDLPQDWPIPVQVFVFWLVVIIWNRDDSASASAASA